jgi:mRNA-degrading endonuclease RelE of RelBE toxin-antitoxin system
LTAGFARRKIDPSVSGSVKRRQARRLLTYRIEYSPECEDHLCALTARDRAIVMDAVDEQLAHQPNVETRRRKLLRPNPLAPWELRVGNLRVFSDVEDDPEPVVHVRAVGVKDQSRLRIGGEEFRL